MENKVENNKQIDKFKKELYYPIRQKAKEMVAYVDKDINPKKLNPINCHLNNPLKSVFSLGDFRHNIRIKSNVSFYGNQISQKPKQFFDWDDGKKFNPKFKKDI